MTQSLKTCTKCKIKQPITNFPKCKKSRDKHGSWCRLCSNLKSKAWREKHKDEERIKQKEWYAKNKHKRKLSIKQWRELNKDRIKTRHTLYKVNNRAKLNAYYRLRRQDPLIKLANNLRNRTRSALRAKDWTKQSHLQDLLGCSLDYLLSWLGPQPDKDASIDHIVPLSIAKNAAEMEKLCHHWNLRWISRSDNSSKSNRWTQEGEELCQVLLGRAWRL